LGELVLNTGLAGFGLPPAGPGWRDGAWRRDSRYTKPDEGCV
jgi:hypothetical protein